MTPSKTQKAILEMGVEDYYNLHEVLWTMKSILPRCTEEELRNVAMSDLEHLVKEGLIKLYRRVSYSGVEQAVSYEDVQNVVRDSSNWSIPSGDTSQIVFAATDLGEAIYHSQSPPQAQ